MCFHESVMAIKIAYQSIFPANSHSNPNRNNGKGSLAQPNCHKTVKKNKLSPNFFSFQFVKVA